MAVEEVVGNLVTELGKIGLWVQALGLIIIFWIIFQIVNLIVNRKKRKTLYGIREDLKRIEGKIDKL